MVQNGKFSAGAALFVKILKKVDLPTEKENCQYLYLLKISVNY
jgi:hypothetical protein